MSAVTTLEISALGSFFAGGEIARVDGVAPVRFSLAPGAPPVEHAQDGEFAVGQMYVQFVRLARPKHPAPVWFWHGGGMTGSAYESTPDERPGWQTDFLRLGFDTFVSDAVERGRASWARYPELYEGAPIFRALEEAWVTFRIGPPESYAQRRTFPGSRFPVAHYEMLARGFVPRWASNNARIEAAYAAALERIGPCTIVAHSQAGPFALQTVQRRPERVRALVLVEPSWTPEPSTAAATAAVPHLVVWGDYIDERWKANRARCEQYLAALIAAGGRATTIDLPARGIHGNSHMLMCDRNSAEVAALIAAELPSPRRDRARRRRRRGEP